MISVLRSLYDTLTQSFIDGRHVTGLMSGLRWPTPGHVNFFLSFNFWQIGIAVISSYYFFVSPHCTDVFLCVSRWYISTLSTPTHDIHLTFTSFLFKHGWEFLQSSFVNLLVGWRIARRRTVFAILIHFSWCTLSSRFVLLHIFAEFILFCMPAGLRLSWEETWHYGLVSLSLL